MFLMESCLNSFIESEIYTKRYIKNICPQQLVFFRNAFINDFSLDEVNTANISLYEMDIL